MGVQSMYLLNGVIYFYLLKGFVKKCVISKPQIPKLPVKALAIDLLKDSGKYKQASSVFVRGGTEWQLRLLSWHQPLCI